MIPLGKQKIHRGLRILQSNSGAVAEGGKETDHVSESWEWNLALQCFQWITIHLVDDAWNSVHCIFPTNKNMTLRNHNRSIKVKKLMLLSSNIQIFNFQLWSQKVQASYFMECLSILFCLIFSYDWIQVIHLWQENHRSDYVFFPLHLVRWCMTDLSLTGDVDFDYLRLCLPGGSTTVLLFPL